MYMPDVVCRAMADKADGSCVRIGFREMPAYNCTTTRTFAIPKQSLLIAPVR